MIKKEKVSTAGGQHLREARVTLRAGAPA